MKIEKKLIKILTFLNLILLILFSLKDDLLTSNLSRIANASKLNYIEFIIISLLYGLEMYLILKRINMNKLAYFGLPSLLIGGVVPYNYLNTTAFTSNLHLICGLVSIIIIFIFELLFINNLNMNFNKYRKLLFFGLAIVGFITLYLYGRFGFMNSLNELIYLCFVLKSVYVVNNVL